MLRSRPLHNARCTVPASKRLPARLSRDHSRPRGGWVGKWQGRLEWLSSTKRPACQRGERWEVEPGCLCHCREERDGKGMRLLCHAHVCSSLERNSLCLVNGKPLIQCVPSLLFQMSYLPFLRLIPMGHSPHLAFPRRVSRNPYQIRPPGHHAPNQSRNSGVK